MRGLEAVEAVEGDCSEAAPDSRGKGLMLSGAEPVFAVETECIKSGNKS